MFDNTVNLESVAVYECCVSYQQFWPITREGAKPCQATLGRQAVAELCRGSKHYSQQTEVAGFDEGASRDQAEALYGSEGESI